MTMTTNRTLAMIVAYYLSRFDEEAVKNLGYSTQSEAFEDISRRLGVKRNTLKNWRDEFDPIHPFRKGWYQRPMSPSRARVVEAFHDLDEQETRQIVLEIVNNKSFQNSADAQSLTSIISKGQRAKKELPFILRSPTGKKAEEFFLKWFETTAQKQFDGKITDTRDLGVGYDFEIRNNRETSFVEVKGLAGDEGGILFTNKEWLTAIEKKGSYYLAIVKNTESSPDITIIRDPAGSLKAQKRIYTTVQVNWMVDSESLRQK